MASKNQHVQDGAVVERRLRPIYEWLESGNVKKALQECDKVLRKTPNLLCAKALKALALLRIGKESEAVAMLDALTKEKPCGDATLQAMTLCYRELQQLEKICRLYETAVKLDPTNEELHTHLFMSYVRVFDFKSQQQSAFTLYKLKPKNPYYCWAVMSVVLQATRGEGKSDPKKRVLLLSLAERMMDKLIGEGKLEAEQEVQLYLMILELQGKHDRIFEVLDGPLGAKLVCQTPAQSKLGYLVKLERWREVNVACKGILAESIDKWDIWKDYVASVFYLSADADPPHNNHTDNLDNLESPDDTPEKAHEFICRLVESGPDQGYLLRGPYLARFELCSKLKERNIDPTDLLGDVAELFVEYYRKFGHKACCVSDLRSYLRLLEGEKRREVAARFVKEAGIGEGSVPQTENQMQRHICALQLSRLCSAHVDLSADHLDALVTALVLHYQHGHQNFSENVLPTDQGPSDPYILFAVHVLYDLSRVTNSEIPLFKALAYLEMLLKNSPSSFHAKLLCVRLYHELGAGLGAQKFFEALDVKHLQLDSLGWIHSARLPTTGLFKEALASYDVTLKFFSSNYKDSSDHLTFCYKFGSFFKLDEFMDFRERLGNSLHYTTTAVDRIVANVVQCTSLEQLYGLDVAPAETKADWDELMGSLIDNHDLSVYVSWDPERTAGPPEKSEEIRRFFEQNVAFLKLRAQIIFALSSAVDVVRSADGTRLQNAEALKALLDEWSRLYEGVSKEEWVPLRLNLTLPLPSRLHSHLNCPYFEVVYNLFRVFLAISLEDVEVVSSILESLKSALTKALTAVKDRISKSANFRTKRDAMEYVVNLVEILCISVTLCLLCTEVARPSHKKGRKKDGKMKEIVNELSAILRDGIQKVEGILKDWTAPDLVEDVTMKLEMLSLDGTDLKSVRDNLVNSHDSAVKELTSVLRAKSKMLNGLLV